MPDLKGRILPDDEAAQRYAMTSARPFLRNHGEALNAVESAFVALSFLGGGQPGDQLPNRPVAN